MVLNEAVQILREADEVKQKILKFKNGVSMLQERNIWVTQQQLQKLYQKLLVLDLDYALDKKVEQDLWNLGFKQQIESLQTISKDRKNPRRSDGQQMLSWVLQAATGFYLCLLHQICTAFKLDLPFRRRASLLGLVETWGAGAGDARCPPPAAALYICQHCLVHLGDLARYRQQLSAAYSFYRHALLVSAHSGQPYNQLALVSWRRGRRLGALYWHVRSLLVRAPFPPAPANLARTLAAAAAAAHNAQQNENLPVIPGVISKDSFGVTKSSLPVKLTAHNFVGELIKAYHLIHTMDDLETASRSVNSLNSALAALIATDSFEPMTLVKMCCITIWLVGWSTEELRVADAALSAAEGAAAALAVALAAGALVALPLGARDHAAHALPALKVMLEWVAANPALLSHAAVRARPQLWPALAHALNMLARHVKDFRGENYEAVPLPEDEELHGFAPLEPALSRLKFYKFAAWDSYGDRVPVCDPAPGTSSDVEKREGEEAPRECRSLSGSAELAGEVRAWRLVQLGRRLAGEAAAADYWAVSTVDGETTFTASQCGTELALALSELRAAAAEGEAGEAGSGRESDSDDEVQPPAPVIISEADFREKVREKRVGILKPQGSLERAREERALIAASQDTQDASGAETASAEEAARGAAAATRTRTNVAMQAILRVQEESGKQVKFVTPATTPDSTIDSAECIPIKEVEKTKILQPKPIKSLANLPVGKKTGGILSLKDKSAGYPHLVNADPEPSAKQEEEKNKKPENILVKQGPGHSQNSQQNNYHPTSYPGKQRPNLQNQHQASQPPPWLAGGAKNIPPTHQSPYGEPPRMAYSHQKMNNQPGFNSLYNQQNPLNIHNQGIRLPVVNPKEIDVRTAALQKQYSRPEFYPDTTKFATQNWQMSADKKAFLNDLPPRFANQFRNWSNTAQQYNACDMKDQIPNESYTNNMMCGNTNPSAVHPNWSNIPPSTETPTQPYNWWGADANTNNFNRNYTPPTINTHPNFYPQSPYQISTYNPMQNQQSAFQMKPIDNPMNVMSPGFMQAGLNQPQATNLQNMMKTPNYNASMGSFGSYNQNVNYDSSMYPQFTNNKLGYQPPAVKMSDKPPGAYSQQRDSLVDLGHGLGLGGITDLHPRSHLTMDLMAGVLANDNLNLMKGLDQLQMNKSGADGTNTYSLFSGGEDTSGAGWGAPHSTPTQHPQSLWSGPGPSPLERLLEQQKQLNKSGEQQ